MSASTKGVKKEVKVEEETVSRRRMIQKVRRKVRRENQRLVEAYSYATAQPRSGIGSLMGNDPQAQHDFDMLNHITTGQNRKLKKKMKKLQKNMGDRPDRVFQQMQKYKQNTYKIQEKKLFSSVNEMQKRRDRRMKKMEDNAKKRKAEITQKKDLERFE